MIRHIVWWTLKEQADGHGAAENALRIQHASAVLHGIPGVKKVELSIKVESTTTVPAQIVLMGEYDDMAALQAYSIHPEHKKFVELIRSVCDSRSCIDYVVD